MESDTKEVKKKLEQEFAIFFFTIFANLMTVILVCVTLMIIVFVTLFYGEPDLYDAWTGAAKTVNITRF